MRSIVTAGILTVGSCIGSSSPSLLMILGGSCTTRGNWLFNKVLLRLWLLLLVPILRRVWQESLFHEPPHWLIERNRGCSGLRTGNFTLIVQLSDNLSSRLRWSYTVIFALFRLLTCPYPQWELSNQLLRGLVVKFWRSWFTELSKDEVFFFTSLRLKGSQSPGGRILTDQCALGRVGALWNSNNTREVSAFDHAFWVGNNYLPSGTILVRLRFKIITLSDYCVRLCRNNSINARCNK